MNQPRLDTHCLGGSPREQDLGGWLGTRWPGHKPSVCLCGKADLQPPGQDYEKYCQHIEGQGSSPLLITGETHMQCHGQFWAHQAKTDMAVLEYVW